MARITINGNTLEPTGQGPRLTVQALGQSVQAADAGDLSTEAEDASKSDYVLVQTKEPITTEEKAKLSEKGLVTLKYVGEDTYLYGYKGTDLKTIREMSFVSWADVYSQHFVVAPELKREPDAGASRLTDASIGTHTSNSIAVDIIFHGDVDTSSGALRSAIATAAHVEESNIKVEAKKMRLSTKTEYLDDLAAIDAVQLIQKVHALKLRNDVARSIISADVLVNGVSYQGEGQIVAVADTGFDIGDPKNTHPAFAGRVNKIYNLGRPDLMNDDATNGGRDDPDGHGTHVCGSVLGDGSSDTVGGLAQGGSSPGGAGPIQGTAPQARLVVQSLIMPGPPEDAGLQVPENLQDLFRPAYDDDKARVHTNSWGSVFDPAVGQAKYDVSSEEIDTFVWDHPDLVICFAAGNDGHDIARGGDGIVDLGQVDQHAGAKNCIAVGASESLRPLMKTTYGRAWPNDFLKAPIKDDIVANNKDGMVGFSSRGPTNSKGPRSQQRFKPDIVAPGTFILSTRSRHAQSTGWGLTEDPNYFWEGGTSMACPLVAGCAAVVRESLEKNGTPKPSAALVKALLINGADEMKGQYLPSETGKTPNNNSGFGRVNLQKAVIIPDPNADPNTIVMAGFMQGGPIQQGVKDTYTIRVPSHDGPGATNGVHGLSTFKITLVWSDPPGEVLQNDLDLIVVASDHSERHGNMDTSSSFDRVNNVEQVTWTNFPPGDLTVVVRAFRITSGLVGGPQPYAFAWRLS